MNTLLIHLAVVVLDEILRHSRQALAVAVQLRKVRHLGNDLVRWFNRRSRRLDPLLLGHWVQVIGSLMIAVVAWFNLSRRLDPRLQEIGRLMVAVIFVWFNRSRWLDPRLLGHRMQENGRLMIAAAVVVRFNRSRRLDPRLLRHWVQVIGGLMMMAVVVVWSNRSRWLDLWVQMVFVGGVWFGNDRGFGEDFFHCFFFKRLQWRRRSSSGNGIWFVGFGFGGA